MTRPFANLPYPTGCPTDGPGTGSLGAALPIGLRLRGWANLLVESMAVELAKGLADRGADLDQVIQFISSFLAGLLPWHSGKYRCRHNTVPQD